MSSTTAGVAASGNKASTIIGQRFTTPNNIGATTMSTSKTQDRMTKRDRLDSFGALANVQTDTLPGESSPSSSIAQPTHKRLKSNSNNDKNSRDHEEEETDPLVPIQECGDSNRQPVVVPMSPEARSSLDSIGRESSFSPISAANTAATQDDCNPDEDRYEDEGSQEQTGTKTQRRVFPPKAVTVVQSPDDDMSEESQKKDLQNQILSLQKENSELRKELEETKEKADQAMKNDQRMMMDNQELKGTIEQKQTEIDRLQALVKQRESNIDSLEAAFEKSKVDMKEIQAKKKYYRGWAEKLETKVKLLKKEKDKSKRPT